MSKQTGTTSAGFKGVAAKCQIDDSPCGCATSFRLSRMTVCIAAICSGESGHTPDTVVVVSDRMLGFGGFELEDASNKAHPLTASVVALTAGDGRKSGEIVSDVRATISGLDSTPTVQDVGDIVAAAYALRRRAEVSAHVFRSRGIEMAQFYSGAEAVNSQVAGTVDNASAQWNYFVDILVAGVDAAGGHVAQIANPGAQLSCDAAGAGVIGTGFNPAVQMLHALGHTAANGVGATIFRAYAAKRHAESAPGVGAATDVSVLTARGSFTLDSSQVEQLAVLYAEYIAGMADHVATLAAKFQWNDAKPSPARLSG